MFVSLLRKLGICVGSAALLFSTSDAAEVSKASFGKTADGKAVDVYTLKGDGGVTV